MDGLNVSGLAGLQIANSSQNWPFFCISDWSTGWVVQKQARDISLSTACNCTCCALVHTYTHWNLSYTSDDTVQWSAHGPRAKKITLKQHRFRQACLIWSQKCTPQVLLYSFYCFINPKNLIKCSSHDWKMQSFELNFQCSLEPLLELLQSTAAW